MRYKNDLKSLLTSPCPDFKLDCIYVLSREHLPYI